MRTVRKTEAWIAPTTGKAFEHRLEAVENEIIFVLKDLVCGDDPTSLKYQTLDQLSSATVLRCWGAWVNRLPDDLRDSILEHLEIDECAQTS